MTSDPSSNTGDATVGTTPHPDTPDTPATAEAGAQRIAVVLMAYGTPRSRDEILPYYTDIRRGRAPSPEQLADLTARYEAIGGVSPLTQLTEAQRDALQAALDALAPGTYEVLLGLKHADPTIEHAVDEIAARGFRRAVGLVLAPHYSSYSIGQYLGRTRDAAEPHGMAVNGVDSWAVEPAFVDFIATDLARRLTGMPDRTRVLFTAHSLPERIIAAGDPYPDELRATAEAVAGRLGLTEGRDWQIAWQSAGRTPEPWIGPDVLDVIDELAGASPVGAERDADGVIVSAVGFVADHLEVLYDLDIEARQRAEGLGLEFGRTACVNDDAAVIGALARRVHAAAQAAEEPASS
ncbi:MAG: ferrochelatase [Ilumatobacter sp.]|uniref:ferrochelatase n=1 Tax=Ilumatobacter sp. TaxID=1967498 RepID=UPI00262A4C1F|nr:ferrochelatase [Ilumatobacter sp.]MDJ0770662.1 ferrochelatase [Ilumatobacter sp.]